MDISGPRVTPSRPDYWTGTPDKSGLTAEQVRRLGIELHKNARLIDQLRRRGLPGMVIHKLRVEPRQQDQAVYSRFIICPVIGGSESSGKLKIIAPNGDETWIDWEKK